MSLRIWKLTQNFMGILIRNYATATETPKVAVSEQLLLTLASPDNAYYKNEIVKQVDIPTMSGNVGLLAKHVPLLAVLKPGVVKVHAEDGTSRSLFVSSGTLSMNIDGTCQVLAEEICPLEDIDMEAVRAELDDAQRRLSSSTNEMEKAQASIAIEVCEALSRAV